MLNGLFSSQPLLQIVRLHLYFQVIDVKEIKELDDVAIGQIVEVELMRSVAESDLKLLYL